MPTRGLLLVADEEAATLGEPGQRPFDHPPPRLVPLGSGWALVADGHAEGLRRPEGGAARFAVDGERGPDSFPAGLAADRHLVDPGPTQLLELLEPADGARDITGDAASDERVSPSVSTHRRLRCSKRSARSSTDRATSIRRFCF